MSYGLGEINEVMAYATGLLVGDMWLERNPNQAGTSDASEAFREEWAAKLQQEHGTQRVQSEWDRGFDRAFDEPLPRGKMGKHLNDNALAIAARISVQAGVVGQSLASLDRLSPRMQREIIEACSRLMRDMDERLASVAGIPNLPE